MAIGTGQFAEDLWPGIMKWFGSAYKDWEPIYPKLVTQYSSDKQFEKYQGQTEFGLAAVKDQGGNIQYRDPYQGFQKEIMNVTYGLGTSITYEMMRYDQYNLFSRIAEQLAKSVRRTEETIAHGPLNNGFATATSPVTTADGLSLFNVNHVLVATTGTTLNNTPTTQADFSQSALEQAYIDIGRFVDDQNLPIVVDATRLIVPVESQHLARKVLNTEYEVNSGNNTINPVSSSRMPLDLVVSPYLTDTDAWFLKTDVDDGIIFQEVDPVMLDRDNEFDSKNLKFSAVRLFGVGSANYLGYYGSSGA
jgi:hypothetical protein